jgi:protein TonB
MSNPFLPWLWRGAGIALFVAVFGCASPPLPPAGPTPQPAPASPPPAALPPAATPTTEADWRQALAQHILAANRDSVFEGRPPHPLKAIVVLELTVDPDGRVQRASVLRAPDHARELGAVAVRTAQAASPLPPPPRALLGRGSVRLVETWLFRDDNRFQLRTLAQTQLIH